MRKHRGCRAILLVLVFLALVPLLTLMAHADHDHAHDGGEVCEICACIEWARSALREMAGGYGCAALGAAALFPLLAAALFTHAAPTRSPVLLRVRMNA